MNTGLPVARAMRPADLPAVIALMRRAPGVSLRDADTETALTRFLERNPGLSAVAESAGAIVACLMAGHDGRRGTLYHLAVDAAWRRQGVASVLVERCLSALAALGIHKVHLDVLDDNLAGQSFWQAIGWTRRDELQRYSMIRGAGDNA